MESGEESSVTTLAPGHSKHSSVSRSSRARDRKGPLDIGEPMDYKVTPTSPRAAHKQALFGSYSVFLFKLLPTFKNQILHHNPNFPLLLKSSNVWQSWARVPTRAE